MSVDQDNNLENCLFLLIKPLIYSYLHTPKRRGNSHDQMISIKYLISRLFFECCVIITGRFNTIHLFVLLLCGNKKLHH